MVEEAAQEKRIVSAIDSGAMDWGKLESQTPPERQWAIQDWLGMGYVTLISGPGGSGKTALAQAILSALAVGNDVISSVIKPRVCLMWAGEDDRDELWRRATAICSWLQIPMSALTGKLYVFPMESQDITLVDQVMGKLEVTPMLETLREQVGDLKAEYVVLDSVARTFGGNENDRHHVTRFVSSVQYAMSPTNAGCGLLGHPAKATDSEFSGSTAWDASVRARLFFGFKLPDQKQDDEEPPDPANQVRYLAKRKTNYSVKDVRQVRYINGVMVPQLPDPGAPTGAKSNGMLADESLHLFRQLKRMGIDATHAHNSPNYLPKAAKNAGLLNGTLSEYDIKRGLGELLRTSRLKVETVGLYANRSPKKGLVEAT